MKDLRKYVEVFFPPLLGREINENENYTRETLNYMCPYVRSLEINDIIISEYGEDIEVVDGCACIGGNSICFMLDERIKNVISYEINDEYYKLLKNNMELYSDGRNKYTIKNESFDETISNGKVVYMDIPWGGEYPYKLKGLQFKDQPIENIVKKCIDNGAKGVILKLPIGYDLMIDDNAKYKDLKKFRIWAIGGR